MPRKHIVGYAKKTKLTGATLGPTGLSFNIEDPTGWPTGGVNGKFWIIANPDQSNEEHFLGSSRSGNSITIAGTGDRGLDGTSAGTHNADSVIWHGFVGAQGDELDAHMFDTARHDHTQYLRSVDHASIVHTAGMLGVDSVGSTHVQANAIGASELADNAVDTLAIANLAVTSGKLATDSVIAGKIAAGAIDDQSRFSADTQPWMVQTTDPGAVGSNKIWFNTTKRTILIRNAANSAWEVLMSLGAGVNYTPTLTNVVIGAGGYNYGRYSRYGKTVIAQGSVFLGTSGGNITGAVGVGLPVPAADLSGTFAGSFGYLGAARGVDDSASQTWAGVGLVRVGSSGTDVNNLALFGTGGSAFWSSLIPFDWTNNDSFTWFVQYEAASAEDANFV